MKIRHPALLKPLGLGLAGLIRMWMPTLRYRYRPLGPNLDPNQPGFEGRYIYAFWHENMLLPAYHCACRNVFVLISQHADGQLIAEAVRHLKFRVVRGSNSRGGIEALRQMLRLSRSAHLAITPDGPRGPRRRVQPGLAYLAARTGLPIVPMGIAYERAWRARSWDRFALPQPWSSAVLVTTEPLVIPEVEDRAVLEYHRLRIEEALHRATEAAEQWAGVA